MKKRPCNDFDRSFSYLLVRNVDKFAFRTAQYLPGILARSGATQEVEKAGSSEAKRRARNTCYKKAFKQIKTPYKDSWYDHTIQ